jgi:hypothetical protein
MTPFEIGDPPRNLRRRRPPSLAPLPLHPGSIDFLPID